MCKARYITIEQQYYQYNCEQLFIYYNIARAENAAQGPRVYPRVVTFSTPLPPPTIRPSRDLGTAHKQHHAAIGLINRNRC